ncbi:hypothetical protein HCN44_010813 [Aphidius gifuensis]|uniref:Uncharacterized protein n=1 Tax=Aphidius gifuensis TaxID=684658 RepID=A0A834XR96_APHGI|nr:zinc finger protein 93-like [Aphidius gifuensis]KAF7991993.1 hypothetical protein HCN44_010813 [Aphidius gifuensis]
MDNNNNNNIHLTLNDIVNLSACNICGGSHESHDCQHLVDLHYIPDSPFLSKARQTLPKNLEIIQMSDGTINVISKCHLKCGTVFGPFDADKTLLYINTMANFPLKIFGKNDNDSYYLDYSNEQHSNWMCFISPASSLIEQNLMCYQSENNIFYTSTRPIKIGEELHVWYAPYYAVKMKMPFYKSQSNQQLPPLESTDDNNNNNNNEIIVDNNNETKNNQQQQQQNYWKCRICYKISYTVVTHAKHLTEHYKCFSGFYCNICNEKFNSIDVLQKHKKQYHTSVKMNQEIGISTFENDQTTITSNNMNDILEKLNADDAINQSMMMMMMMNKNNSNELSMENIVPVVDEKFTINAELSTNLLNIETNTTSLIQIQNQNQNNIVPLDCDICNKVFEKPENLHRHLRKHTGEFICSSCLVVFSKKENLKSHECFSKNINNLYECPICQKNFTVKKNFKRHMIIHTQTNYCKFCKQIFTSKRHLDEHKCENAKFVCDKCNKKLISNTSLNRHMKLHDNPKPKNKKQQQQQQVGSLICEKCGEIFNTIYSLKQHFKSHMERQIFKCTFTGCLQTFNSIGLFETHKKNHIKLQVTCSTCQQVFKNKKALDVHLSVDHANGIKNYYHCDKCDKSFLQLNNLKKHYKQTHVDDDDDDDNINDNDDDNGNNKCHERQNKFSCELCAKVLNSIHQLKRHKQASHSGIIYSCPYCDMKVKHRHSIKRHLERQHNGLSEQWNQPNFIDTLTDKNENSTIIAPLPPLATLTPITPLATLTPLLPLPPLPPLAPLSLSSSSSSPSLGLGTDLIVKNNDISVSDKINLQLALADHIVDNNDNNNNNNNDDDNNNNLLLNEIPQLRISDTDTQLAQSVLGNAFILDEHGENIMLYVLGN